MENHDEGTVRVDATVRRCPFCGGKAQRHMRSGDERNGYADSVYYRCEDCFVQRGASGITDHPGYADNSNLEERALAAWNQRTDA